MKRLCVIEGCDRLNHARGWCSTHYLRAWRYGDPHKVQQPYRPHPTLPLAERFWRHVDKSAGPDGCWEWLGVVAEQGYGRYRVGLQSGPRLALAHRVAYELLVGPLSADQHLDHLCHNADPTCFAGSECRHRRCVNPAHLEPVTAVENGRRQGVKMQSRGPASCPECDKPFTTVQGVISHRRLAHPRKLAAS